jgi:hypothetical protein
MDLTDRLSKTRYTKGLRCPLALYLHVHHFELATPADAATQARFDVGNRVGALAQQRYPGGVLIEDDHLHHREAVEHTKEALAAGAPAIFEAAFTHDNVKVRVDVLVALPEGGYELVEVKSPKTYDSKKHLPDAAVQLYVLLGSGIGVRKVTLMHLNGDYVYPGGEYDPNEVLTSTDITKDAFEYIERLPAEIAEMMRMLARPEPPAPPARINCEKPYECEFLAWCTRDEVPIDLSEPVEFVPAVLKRLDDLPFPLYFADFETVMPGLPIFVGTSPYQVSQLQWSVHVLHADGRLEHLEWLADSASENPGREFIGTLFDALGTEGTFMHYSYYERTQLVEIAVRHPEWRQPLVDRIPGFYDPLARKLAEKSISYADLRAPATGGLLDFDLGVRVVKDGCLHPIFGSKGTGYTIKSAIQVLAPNLPSYESLAISDGVQAMLATQEMLDPATDPERAAAVRTDLLAYCKQDTEAMVEIYRNLKAIAR